MSFEDTIAAIATASGVGGIGVIRVSGKHTLSALEPIFQFAEKTMTWATVQSHRLYRGWVYEQKQPIDEVLLAVMKAPHSYTTEDVAEIHCHGNPMVLHTILELILQQNVRLAQPGEFTQRAFLQGRLDLTQVEAVADLLQARSKLGVCAAVNQLQGKLYQAIEAVKAQIFHVAALLEATIDFSDEDETFTHRDDCLARLVQAQKDLETLLASAEKGKLMRSGLGVALIGKPNSGKSSLLNALLGEQRAIVTSLPGTTRDVIEEAIQIKGLAIRLLDTAGIRTTKDVVEHEGVKRSQNAWANADVVLLVLDCSAPLCREDEQLLAQANPEKTLVVWNKKDLLPPAASTEIEKETLKKFSAVLVSAKYSEGLHELENALFQKATQGNTMLSEEACITNLRQQQAAQKALAALREAIAGLEQEIGEECLAVDLAQCLRALGEIVGETTPDDLLNHIFSEFCIGK